MIHKVQTFGIPPLSKMYSIRWDLQTLRDVKWLNMLINNLWKSGAIIFLKIFHDEKNFIFVSLPLKMTYISALSQSRISKPIPSWSIFSVWYYLKNQDFDTLKTFIRFQIGYTQHVATYIMEIKYYFEIWIILNIESSHLKV